MSKYSGSCEWTPAQTILVIHTFTVPATMISWSYQLKGGDKKKRQKNELGRKSQSVSAACPPRPPP